MLAHWDFQPLGEIWRNLFSWWFSVQSPASCHDVLIFGTTLICIDDNASHSLPPTLYPHYTLLWKHCTGITSSIVFFLKTLMFTRREGWKFRIADHILISLRGESVLSIILFPRLYPNSYIIGVSMNHNCKARIPLLPLALPVHLYTVNTYFSQVVPVSFDSSVGRAEDCSRCQHRQVSLGRWFKSGSKDFFCMFWK